MSPGEKISLEKTTEVLLRVARETRGYKGTTRNEDGEINDYLEKRRPFLNPNPTNASH